MPAWSVCTCLWTLPEIASSLHQPTALTILTTPLDENALAKFVSANDERDHACSERKDRLHTAEQAVTMQGGCQHVNCIWLACSCSYPDLPSHLYRAWRVP